MPLVAAQCTNCGAALQVDNSKDAAVCQYCGSAFIVEKAIHNYEINNTYNIFFICVPPRTISTYNLTQNPNIVKFLLFFKEIISCFFYFPFTL